MKIKGNLLFALLLLISSVYAANLKYQEYQHINEEDLPKNAVTSTTSNETCPRLTSGDTVPSSQTEELYETCPRFPGGDKALLDFIKRNMCYPKCAKEKKIEGRVVVCFYVETDGSISNLNITRSVDSVLNEEALRIIKNMPKWEPGQLGGEIVRMRCFVPIVFRCEDSK